MLEDEGSDSFSSSQTSISGDEDVEMENDVRSFREKWEHVFDDDQNVLCVDQDDSLFNMAMEEDFINQDDAILENSGEILTKTKKITVSNADSSYYERQKGYVFAVDASEEISALDELVRRDRKAREKRDVVNTLRKNEREMRCEEMKTRKDAQVVIARYVRIWFRGRVCASVMMQKFVRGFLARASLSRKVTCVIRLQRRWRVFLFRTYRINAALLIQNSFRAFMIAKKMQKERKQNSAATVMQKYERRRAALYRFKVHVRKVQLVQKCVKRWINKRNVAVQIIQRSFRAFMYKRYLGTYAIVIQSRFRGYRVRKAFASVLRETANLPTLSDSSSSYSDFDDDLTDDYTTYNNSKQSNDINDIGADSFYFTGLLSVDISGLDADIHALKKKQRLDDEAAKTKQKLLFASAYTKKFEKRFERKHSRISALRSRYR